MRNTALLFAICCSMAAMCPAQREQNDCKSRSFSRTDKCYRIDTSDVKTQGLRQATVVSGDRVYVEIARRPTEKCVLQTKAEPVTPEGGGGTIFKILSGAVVPAALVAETDSCRQSADSDPAVKGKAKPAEVVPFDADSDALFALLVDLKARIKIARQDYIDTAKQLLLFQNCKDAAGHDVCNDKDLFIATQTAMQNKIDDLLKGPIPSSSVVDSQLQKVQDDLKAIKDPVWFVNKATQVACYAASVAGVKAVLSDMSTSRQPFAKAIDLVRSMTWPADAPKLIPPQRNAKATATLSCTNIISGDSAIDPVTLVITYKDIPRTTVDAGVLVSLIPKQVIGTTNVKTGENNGVPTFKTIFAITDSAPVQAIPFSFVNLRIYHWRTRSHIIAASATGGVGVNPNSGTKEAEFFAGSGLSIGSFVFHFGAHFGEFKNLGGGFSLGEAVPSSFGSVPIRKGYTIHPGFALSYRIPLP